MLVVRTLAAALALAWASATPAAGPDAAEDDRARLQGVWAMTENVVNGTRAGETQVRSWLLVIEGDQYNPGSGETSVEYSFRLDPTRTPKAIDFIPAQGTDRGKVYRGVYALEGDTLVICRPLDPEDDRPAGLTARSGSNLIRVVWKRRKGS